MRPTSAPAPRWTSSSCVLKRWTRSSICWKHARFSKASVRFRSWRWSTDDQGSENREQGTGIRDQGSVRHKSSVHHPFRFFPRKGWEPTKSHRPRGPRCAITCCGLPAGYAESAKDHRAARFGDVCRSSRGEAAGGEYSGARTTARRQLLLYRRYAGCERLSRGAESAALPGDLGSAEARRGTVQYLLHAVSLARGQRTW